MKHFPLQQHHLEQLRRHAGMLVTRIESHCGEADDPAQRHRLECTCAFAHALLEKVSMTEEVVLHEGRWNDLTRRFEERFRAGQERLDSIGDELHRIDGERHGEGKHPSSGSLIGDAVRDSFLNLG
ncbi:MAG: hypothetical protein H6835_04210 [Planctomycetes bacterium]|nr:hypothetical protein [Planctomycetota bacterium]